MTPEAQEGYIITERGLKLVKASLKNFHYDLVLEKLEEEIRPYKSDDAVLDDFVDWCRDAISSLEEKQCDGYKQFADVVKIELLHHELKIIKELRLQQKGGGER